MRDVFGVEQVQSLIDIIALGMPLSALATVPTILLRVRLEFRKIAAINFGETVATQILTIALAFGGLGVYSFAIPSPVVAALKSAALWVAAPGDLSGTWRKVLLGAILSAAAWPCSLLG